MVAAQLPKRIFVGLDERGLADNAIHSAISLSNAFGAKLELLHAVPALPPSWPGLTADQSMERSDRLLDAAREAALAHVRELLHREPLAQQKAEQLVRVIQGRAADVLLAEANGPNDLVVLGANRHEGLLQFGGTLRRLLASSNGPLWVQPHPIAYFRRILVPIDMSSHSLHALALAAAFAKRFSARVLVLHAFRVAYPLQAGWPEAAMWTLPVSAEDLRAGERTTFEESLAGFDWDGVEHEEAFVEGDPAQAILEHAPEHDIVALGTHGRSGIAATVLGSVAWRVIERCDRPLLVTRLGAE